MKNIEVIRKMYELFALKDNEAIRSIFDIDIKWNQMIGFPGGGRYVGADAVFENVFEGFRQNWTDWKTTIQRYIDAGDSIIVNGFYEGTYRQTGRYVRADFMCEYKIKNFKIIEFNQYTDTFLIARAMGQVRELA